MEKNLTVRIFKIISLILIIGAIIGTVLVTISDTAMKEDVGLQNRILNPYFTVAYIALGLCVLLALLFPIINIISQPKNAIPVLIGIGVVIVLGFISYAISDNELTTLQLRAYKITESASRQIGAALIATYFIAGASILAIVYAEISNLIKNKT